jgi:hypothetical protein
MNILDSFEKLSIKDTGGGPVKSSFKKSDQSNRNGGQFSLRAECRDMCSADEVSMRVKNKLVHVLEKRIVKCVSSFIFFFVFRICFRLIVLNIKFKIRV